MNFWNQLEKQQITREQLQPALFKKLGQPVNELQTNLAQELIKKITSYYFTEEENQNFTTHFLTGTVLEISEKKFKEGKQKGQTYYALKLTDRQTLQVKPENLTEDQWTQVTNLEVLGQNLVFKYRKWFNNKQVLDFYEPPKGGKHE
jgi:hypothetical protein